MSRRGQIYGKLLTEFHEHLYLPSFAGLSRSEGGGPVEATADEELIEWLKERIAIPKFTTNLWNDEHNLRASEFLVNPNITKLILYMDPHTGLNVSHTNVAPLKKVRHHLHMLTYSQTAESRSAQLILAHT